MINQYQELVIFLTGDEIEKKYNVSIGGINVLYNLIKSMERVGLLAQQPDYVARRTPEGRVVRTRPYNLNESFNGKLRDECLNGERFYTLKEAQVIIEQWRNHYNHFRPHSSIGIITQNS